MGLFITEVKTVALASLILAGSSAVGCSDSATVSITSLPVVKTETVGALASHNVSIGAPPCVDYIEFTEVDPNNAITVSDNLIEFTDLNRTTDSYVRYDSGPGAFGTQFTHYTSLSIDSTPDSNGTVSCWALTEDPLASLSDMIDVTDGMAVYVVYSTQIYPAILIYARSFDGAIYRWQEITDFSFPLTYYIKIIRDGSVCSVYVYSDSNYSTLVTSISAAQGFSCHETNTYRYIYSLTTVGGQTAAGITGDIGCLGVDSILDKFITKSESTTVTAAPTVRLDFLKISASETVGVADDPSRYINPLVVTKTETIKIKEGRQYSSLWPEGEEIVSVTDSPTLELSFLRVSQSDSVAATDSKTLTRDLRISQSDNLSVIGSSTLEINPLVVTNCDDVSISEQRTLGYDLVVVKSEGVGVSGVDTTRIDALLVEGSDEVGVAEVVAGVADAIGAVSDEAGIVDSNTVEVKAPETCEPALSEGVGASDSAVVRLGWLSVVESELVGIGEAKSFINDLAVPRMDGISVTDVPTVFVNDLAVHQTDPVSVNDGEASGEVDLDKRDLESVGISEEITVKFSAAGAVKSESVGVSDSPSAWVPPFPRGSDSVGISEARTLGFDPLRVEKAEQVGVSDGLVGTRFSLLVSKTDQVSLSETRTALPETVDLEVHKTERVAVQSVRTVTSTVFLLLENDIDYLCLEGGTSAATHWGGRIILWGSAEQETQTLSITPFEEYAAVSDSATVRLAQVVVSQSGGVAVSEARDVRLGALEVEPSESVGVGEVRTAALVAPVYPIVSDSASVEDSASVRLAELVVAGTDEAGVEEGLRIGLTPLEVSQSDEIGASEVVDARIGDVIESASDAVEVADSAVVALQLVRDFSDGAEVRDSAIVALAELVVEQRDSVGIDEETGRNLDLLVSQSDGIGVEETNTRVLDLLVSQGDDVGVSEAGERSLDLLVSGSDEVEVGEAGERCLDLMVSGSDEIEVSDTPDSWVEPAILYSVVTEQVGVSEARILGPDLEIGLSESVGVSEVRLARPDLRISGSDEVGISETKRVIFDLVKLSQGESIGVSERRIVYVGLVPGTGHWVPEGLLRGAYRLKLVT